MIVLPFQTHQQLINSIYKALYTKNYTKAEILLISFIEEILLHSRHNEEQTEKDRNALEIIYNRFNEKYLKWIRLQGKDPKKEQTKQTNHNHKNYLLAHCFDPVNMHTLLSQLELYLKELPNNKRKQEIKNLFHSYRDMLHT